MVGVAGAGYWEWESVEERSSDGAVSSAQRARFARPVVRMEPAGALMLSRLYWREVERGTGGLVRARVSAAGVVLRVVGGGPALLRFGPAEVTTDSTGVACVHEIVGGLLARRASGVIRFEQRTQDGGVLVVSAICGFYPALAARPGAPAWTGELYKRVQAGVEARPPYSLRHTFAYWSLRAGVPIATVAREMGHASTEQTFRVYGGWCREMGADAATLREAWAAGTDAAHVAAETES